MHKKKILPWDAQNSNSGMYFKDCASRAEHNPAVEAS